MKIVRLKVDDFMRIGAAEIKPDGSMVVLSGRNRQGKSSILKAIHAAIGGRECSPSKPIREGATKGSVLVELDNGLRIRKGFTAGGESLIIESEDGQRFATPQKMLDAMYGALTFDPLAFTRMKSRDQVETLRGLVGLDFTKTDAERAKLYSERTDVNREVTRLEGQIGGMPKHEDAPKEAVVVSEMLAKIQRIESENRRLLSVHQASRDARLSLARQQKDFERSAETVRSEIATLKQRLAAAEKNLAAQLDEIEAVKEQLASTEEVAAPVLADTAAIQQQITYAEVINRKVRENDARADVSQRLRSAREKSEKLTDAIEKIDEQKRTALATAKFPVAGLSFSDSGVVFNGLPFDQASDAEQLRASVAIGMASNPELRVMMVRDGNHLDPDGLDLLAKIGAEFDAQLWVECVSKNAKTTVIIEDGNATPVQRADETQPAEMFAK